MALLGIDIGGTKTIVAVADDSGNILTQERIVTPRERGPEFVLSTIESGLRRLLDQTGTSQEDVRSIGIGCGGPIDRERGLLLTAPNLPGWDNLDLVGYFQKAFNADTYLDNDVSLAALGEARRGVGTGVDHLAYFNIGTGIGGGIVIGGKLYRGCGNAGEFGHQVILPDGPPCLCGKRGCLESLCSGTSIARRAQESLADCPDSIVLKLAGNISRVTAEHVAEAARMGDQLALSIWDETGEYLGIGVANVINILNPRMVVIGGGIIKAADPFFDKLKQTVTERAMTQLAQDVEVVLSQLGDQAGITGAIQLALDQD